MRILVELEKNTMCIECDTVQFLPDKLGVILCYFDYNDEDYSFIEISLTTETGSLPREELFKRAQTTLCLEGWYAFNSPAWKVRHCEIGDWVFYDQESDYADTDEQEHTSSVTKTPKFYEESRKPLAGLFRKKT